MKVNVVRVGNSRGIRIPKPMLEQCGIGDQVELKVRDRSIVLSPPTDLRAGWDEAFARAAAGPSEPALLDDRPSDWDKSEWRW